MSEHDFILWLKGYLDGGGTNLQEIQAKLQTAATWTEPVRDDRVWFPGITPTFPPPQIPFTTDTPPIQPPWEVTCGPVPGIVEGTVKKGGVNEPNTSNMRPPAPGGSGPKPFNAFTTH